MANYHLTAVDIMQTEVATVLGDATIQEAAAIMRYEGVRSLLIIPRDGTTNYGIITYSDIVTKLLAEGQDPRHINVDAIARQNAYTIDADTRIQHIARLFRDHNCGHAPVVDSEGQLLGVVSMTDLITEVITEPD